MIFIPLTEDENLVFRGNSFATKAMDSYMKMIGESVIQQRFLVFENYCCFFRICLSPKQIHTKVAGSRFLKNLRQILENNRKRKHVTAIF